MTPSPSSSTVPEHSKPGMNGGFRGLGYSPWRCAMSAKLRPLGDFFKKMVYLQTQLTFKTIALLKTAGVTYWVFKITCSLMSSVKLRIHL